jgi:hypothetical protein
MQIAVNVIAFQIGWFACVLGAAHGVPWIGAAAAAAIAAWHVSCAHRIWREIALLALAAAVGLVFDSALIQLGLIHFNAGVIVEGIAPYWMLALWIAFATTLNVSLRALHRRPLISSVLGGVGGALAYYSGARLGAMEILSPARTLLVVALGWALLTPTLLAVARRYDGFARP